MHSKLLPGLKKFFWRGADSGFQGLATEWVRRSLAGMCGVGGVTEIWRWEGFREGDFTGHGRLFAYRKKQSRNRPQPLRDAIQPEF
jgi:hypothetical protein